MSNGLDSVAPQRRARDLEIIDVDSLDDDAVPTSRRTSAQPPPVPLQRGSHSVNGTSEPGEVIVLDSDEDEPAVRMSGAARRGKSRFTKSRGIKLMFFCCKPL